MASADYEEFVYGAGHLDDPDPIAPGGSMSARQAKVAERLASVSTLRIVAEDTDLTIDVGGRTWLNADGRQNFPDGEVFTSPRTKPRAGTSASASTATYHGREFGGVRLWFEDGTRGRATRPAAASSSWRGMLDMDEGARDLGEVAFGINARSSGAPATSPSTRRSAAPPRRAGHRFPEAAGTNRSGAALGHRLRPAQRRRGLRRRRADGAGRAVPVSDPRIERLARVIMRATRCGLKPGRAGADPGARRWPSRWSGARRGPPRAGRHPARAVGRRGVDHAYLSEAAERQLRLPAALRHRRDGRRWTCGSRSTRRRTRASCPGSSRPSWRTRQDTEPAGDGALHAALGRRASCAGA